MVRSLIMAGCLALTGACTALAQGAGDVQNLPPPIQSEISQAEQACTEGKPSLEKGFVTREDINGTGVSSYILDYKHFGCGGRHSLYCGTTGCEMQVFTSSPTAGFQSIFDGNVRSLTFTKIAGHPAMVVDLHSAGCGGSGKAACDETLYWDGSGFSQPK